MRKCVYSVIVVTAIVLLIIILLTFSAIDKMELKSSAFANGKSIPKKYTCEGSNISPPLEISGVPSGAKSLALIMYDADVPHEFKQQMNIEGWDHWIVWNIDSNVNEIPEGEKPGIEGKQTGGDKGYTGPCPPKDKSPAKHRYFFWLYALDTELDLPEAQTSKADLEQAMEGHVLEKAELMGVYEKEN